MKYLKKTICLLLCLGVMFAAVGCSGRSDRESSAGEARTEKVTETEIPTEEFGIIAQEEKDYYVHSTKVVDILDSPTEGAGVIGKVYNGERVPVTGTVDHWSRVIYSGCVCYIDNTYLKDYPPSDSETVEETTEETIEETTETQEETTETVKAVGSEDKAVSNVEQTQKAEAKHVVCIDAGHQKSGISEKEPNGPGSSEMKAKLATGTQGTTTGVAEHVVNLAVSKLLEQELEDRGYEVIMIRETDDCPLSNAERAQVANESGAEIFIRVHANGSDDPNVNGIVAFAPSYSNPYVSSIAPECNKLSQLVADKSSAVTGAKNLGVQQSDTMTGINWCQIPVTIIEMGFMSNPTEDVNLSDPSYQQKLAVGIADGVDAYFVE